MWVGRKNMKIEMWSVDRKRRRRMDEGASAGESLVLFWKWVFEAKDGRLFFAGKERTEKLSYRKR